MYRIFISHSWTYSEQYDRIEQFLDEQGIEYYNHSVPKDDPVHTNGSDWELAQKIEAKIKGCSCVIILAGVYASYSKWIDKEVEIALYYQKPIIAVKPWGNIRISSIVQKAANTIVNWNGASIARAVEEYSLNTNSLW